MPCTNDVVAVLTLSSSVRSNRAARSRNRREWADVMIAVVVVDVAIIIATAAATLECCSLADGELLYSIQVDLT